MTGGKDLSWSVARSRCSMHINSEHPVLTRPPPSLVQSPPPPLRCGHVGCRSGARPGLLGCLGRSLRCRVLQVNPRQGVVNSHAVSRQVAVGLCLGDFSKCQEMVRADVVMAKEPRPAGSSSKSSPSFQKKRISISV